MGMIGGTVQRDKKEIFSGESSLCKAGLFQGLVRNEESSDF